MLKASAVRELATELNTRRAKRLLRIHKENNRNIPRIVREAVKNIRPVIDEKISRQIRLGRVTDFEICGFENEHDHATSRAVCLALKKSLTRDEFRVRYVYGPKKEFPLSSCYQLTIDW